MSVKRVILVFIFAIFILAGMGVIYYLNQGNVTEDIPEITTREVYVEAIDVTTDERVAVDFVLMSNRSEVLRSTTNTKGLEKIDVPLSVGFMEFYIQDPRYYTYLQGLIGSKTTMEARPIGNMKVYHMGKLNSTNDNIRILIETDAENNELSYCLAWSNSVIDVTSVQHLEKKILDIEDVCIEAGFDWILEETICNFWCDIGFKDKNVTADHCSVSSVKKLPPTFMSDERIDKCYYSRTTINKGEPLIFDLHLETYNTVSSSDYLEIYIIDSNNNIYNSYQFENSSGADWGAQTIKYTIIGI